MKTQQITYNDLRPGDLVFTAWGLVVIYNVYGWRHPKDSFPVITGKAKMTHIQPDDWAEKYVNTVFDGDIQGIPESEVTVADRDFYKNDAFENDLRVEVYSKLLIKVIPNLQSQNEERKEHAKNVFPILKELKRLSEHKLPT